MVLNTISLKTIISDTFYKKSALGDLYSGHMASGFNGSGNLWKHFCCANEEEYKLNTLFFHNLAALNFYSPGLL